MSHTLHIHPKDFRGELKVSIEKQLKEQVEGTCSGRYGYIIMVQEIHEIGAGVLVPATGFAEFRIPYTALLLKPFKNEVVDGVVTNVNKNGFFMEIGPLNIFVSELHIPKSYQLDNSTTTSVYKNPDGEIIGPGSAVRARIIGTRVDQNDIFGVGAIDEEYLGLQTRQNQARPSKKDDRRYDDMF
ncbi:hypothetical protein SmJEL517_g02761 [Synchytrium microbalum]|uniref:S1 motif domain-containing protein n=1 Tax=Synchytrium microbalum TaxID=1806994 RepID=A0A507CAW7_9FUNG|nr:uncharacterized protein SmJEL517_g02761 [Synchytrium microbalum]TPX34675.1 hypothetical protein SmJEL517_g02761 [Synchytrium microbalum]